jgi:predicted ATP-grasp superfamily ATP-dependent carboligase
MSRTCHIPAIVLGVELNGIGVVRSLAHARIPVIAVDTDWKKPGMRTRYGRKYRVASMEGEALIRDLVQLGQTQSEPPVLFITQEATVQTISKYRKELEPYFRLTLPASDCVDMLTDKDSFQRFAEQHRFRVPKTLNVVDEQSLDVARQFRYPVVLKPARRNHTYSRNFDKAYRVENFSDLAELCHKILPVFANLIVQEWIEGGDSDIYFCLQYFARDGAPVTSFIGRKIRSWPPQTGGTASCIAASGGAINTLAEETTRFFRVAGFTGMGSMEYKRDSVTGKFYMIEPTVGRTDYQEEVATLNGVNIPYAAWLAETGQNVRKQEQRLSSKPIVWRNTSIDRRSAALQAQYCGHGQLDRGKKLDGWWRWYDPMPALVMFWRRIGPAVQKRIKQTGLSRRASG